MFSCARCGAEHSEGTVCSVCKRNYDFQCSGVTESGYRKLGDRKNTWRCPGCKLGASPTPTTVSPHYYQLEKIQEQLAAITTQLAPLPSLLEDIKVIKAEFTGLKESIEMAHALLADFSNKMQTLEEKVLKTEKITDEVFLLKNEVERINKELNDRDQFARANNVEIRGIPEKKSENLYNIAQKIGDLCNISISKEEINYIARIPTRVPNISKSIVMSFNNRYKKEELVTAARKCKQLNLSNLGFSTAGNVFVNDHLTLYSKSLLGKAKKLATEKNFKYIWVKHCKIMARKSDTSPVFTIKCEKDLLKIS